MKITPNIGILNALIRITCGLTMLTWCTAKLVRRPRCQSYLLVSILSAMKVAEGIVRYCPVTDFLKRSQNNSDKNQSDYDNHDIHTEPADQNTNGQNDLNLMNELKKFQESNK